MDRDAASSGYGAQATNSFQPNYASASLSADAWLDMLGSGGVGGALVHAPTINYHGAINYPILPVGTGHDESWRGFAPERGGSFYVRESSVDWFALAGVPAAPPGASGPQFEEPYSSTISRALSLDVDFFLGGDSRWHLFMDGPNSVGDSYDAVDDGFRLDSDVWPLFRSPDAPDLGNSGSQTYDIAPINQWKDEWVAAGGLTFVDPSRGPKLMITWTGDWPQNTLGPDYDYDLPDAWVTVTYRWQMSRWRWVYYEDAPVPYRRIHPRDDMYGDGSSRVFPPSKGQQSANRTFSGYY